MLYAVREKHLQSIIDFLRCRSLGGLIEPLEFGSIMRKAEVVSRLQKGILHGRLSGAKGELVSFLDAFAKSGSSCSLILSGLPGSGKSMVVKEAVKEAEIQACKFVEIDCRIYGSDKSASKRLFSELNCPPSSPILDALRTTGSTIIYFDHFDSLKVIKRQFFLYTLFDSIHTNTISLCVILSTSTLDPCSGLEKRVKSRLTPHVLTLPPPTISVATDIIKSCVHLEGDEEWNSKLPLLDWERALAPIFESSPSYHTAITFAIRAVLSQNREILVPATLEEAAAEISSINEPSRFIKSLSHIELILIFVGAYIQKALGQTEFSFEAIMREIHGQIFSLSQSRLLSDESVQFAFDTLCDLKVFNKIGKDGSKVSMMVFDEDLKEIAGSLPTYIESWVKGWID